jgi:hypothetical protein
MEELRSNSGRKPRPVLFWIISGSCRTRAGAARWPIRSTKSCCCAWHAALRPSTSLTGGTRPTLVRVFDSGMRVASSAGTP